MLVLKVDNGPLWIALSNFPNARPNFSPSEVAAINDRFQAFNLDIRRIRRVSERDGHYFRVTCPRMIWFRQDWVSYILDAPAEPVNLFHFDGCPLVDPDDAPSAP